MIDLAVIGGGPSSEHDVSVRSATEVFRALDRSSYHVWPVFWDRDGTWHLTEAPLGPDAGTPFLRSVDTPGVLPGVGVCRLLDHGVRCVFPALHGPFGEDGRLQGMLDLHGLAYVGSGPAASAVAMDKVRTRECLTSQGVPMARAFSCTPPTDPDGSEAVVQEILRDVGLPCFAKVDVSGSSYGVARCADAAELRAFFEAHSHADRVVIEESLSGEEISVPVLGNRGGALRALLPVGIYVRDGAFFDVAAKYEPGRTEEVVPPRGLDAAGIRAVQDLALRCHAALGCDGVSRTDMIVTSDGPRVLELNSLPGMTPMSLLPRSAAAEGLGFSALLDEMVGLAIARQREATA
jgi:D-alanine-D-alanine ligase